MEPKYIGIDLHKAFFQVCEVDAQGTRVWEAKIPRTDGGMTLFRAHCSAATSIAVEAMGPTWAFVDALHDTFARICVVDPRKTRLKAGFAAKTDRLDARRLADALRRDSVVSVYIPTPAIRELREVCRGRNHLVRVRTRLAQMIRALLLRNGAPDIPVCRAFSAPGLAWLREVVVPAEAARTLAHLRQVLDTVQAEVVIAEARVVAIAQRDPIVRALDTLVGVGPVLGLTLRAEIGDIARFPGGPQLASYAGLVPRVAASANRYWSGRITRDGSRWLRWALVEAARHAIRRPDRVGRWARQLALRKGVCTARVALARRLCDDVMRVWPRE